MAEVMTEGLDKFKTPLAGTLTKIQSRRDVAPAGLSGNLVQIDLYGDLAKWNKGRRR